jgi:hypothetical protein
MVKEMQSAVSAGVMGMDKFSECFGAWMKPVSTSLQIIHQGADAARRERGITPGHRAQM